MIFELFEESRRASPMRRAFVEHHFDAPRERHIGEEVIAEELRLAATTLGRLTGRVDVEDLLDVIFRDFCIGK